MSHDVLKSEAVALYNALARVPTRDGYAFERASAEEHNYRIRLEGPICLWNKTSSSFQDALDLIDGKGHNVFVRINSGGGVVTEGWAIHDSLANAKARTVAEIIGIAASAASFAALGCDEVLIAPNALFMIHEARIGIDGNADDFRTAAERLEAMNDQMAERYAAKSGKSKEEVRAMMKKETWFRGQAAVDAGFADGLLTGFENARACVEPETLMAYRNTPQELIEMAQAQTETQTQDQNEATTTNDAGTKTQSPAAEAQTPAAETDTNAAPAEQAPAAEAAPASKQATAQVDVEEVKRVASIEAACAMFKQPEKAKGFVEAKASLDDVRKALWNAYAEANSNAPNTATTAPLGATAEEQSMSIQAALNQIRASQFARSTPKN